MEFRIGCSGWSYRHWRGDFYPSGLPASRWLEHYAAAFDTVELNASFYRLPLEGTVRGWRDRTPAGFRFAVKASRLITHYRRLLGAEHELATFLNRLSLLDDRLGPLLFQLPPGFRLDVDRLERFLRLLPHHQAAFEFRDQSWWTEEVWSILRGRGAMFVLFNLGETTTPVVATGSEAYVRLHGPGSGYAGSYDDGQLAAWRERLGDLGVQRAWVYFNNDVGGHAPRNALRLRELCSR